MADLVTKPAELRITLQIVRAATGKIETVDLVGDIIPAPEAQPATTEEPSDGSHPQHDSP